MGFEPDWDEGTVVPVTVRISVMLKSTYIPAQTIEKPKQKRSPYLFISVVLF
jgi:hypothetical protein